jgi:hypothetical protein
MFDKVPERQMHIVRWLVTSGWLLLIFSLFYDPISPWLTDSKTEWSPLRIDPSVCIKVQGVCLDEKPYALGAGLFWGIIIPAAIFILLVFGHELWRRICPLSFLSQIPAALKWHRQHKRVDRKTGRTFHEVVKVNKDSWLGRNYLYVQFGWFYVGLCGRILVINSDRLSLMLWLLFTIGAAITVGYLYGGKSWCQYFCPMAPVQKIFAEPGGLLTSKAHTEDQSITQSMCRIVNEDGREQSACVACKSPCIDIDSERSYWDSITAPQQKFLYYSYFGLVVGYFFYYYLYAGNWDYYLSGAWTHDPNQLASLLHPGFYLFGKPVPVPKLVAVPLTLGSFSWGGYVLGRRLEGKYKHYLRRKHQFLKNEEIQHRIFTLCTFLIFNIFFIFGGRPFVLLLPATLQNIYTFMLVLLSTLWLTRTWKRSPELYSRESLASRFRKQLAKLKLDVSQFIEGRSLDDLNTHEVYVLAKVLPGFTREKRLQAYKGVLREALDEGYVNSPSSLEVLQKMRLELDISDEEHQTVLTEVSVEDPELLNPSKQRTLENQVRLESFRNALGAMLEFQRRHSANERGSQLPKGVEQRNSLLAINNVLQKPPQDVQTLMREYAITSDEQEQVIADLDRGVDLLRQADVLLSQLKDLVKRYQALSPLPTPFQAASMNLLRATLQQKERLFVKELLRILESLSYGSLKTLGFATEATRIARSLGSLELNVLPKLMQEQISHLQQRLSSQIISLLNQPKDKTTQPSEVEPAAIVSNLEALLHEPDPLTQPVILYLLYQLDAPRSREQARQLLDSDRIANALVRETAEMLLAQETQPGVAPAAFRTIEKLVSLFNNDLFGGMKSETLVELAYHAQFRVYNADEVVIEQGKPSQELLLLIEGEVQLQIRNSSEVIVENLLPGQILTELNLFTSTEEYSGTIIARVPGTRILVINLNTCNDLLCQDSGFARRVLEMESRRLQQIIS